MNTLLGATKLLLTSLHQLDMVLASGGIENARSALQENDRRKRLLAATAPPVVSAPAEMDCPEGKPA